MQLHLFLGYFLGSAAVHIVHAATGPALVALAVIVVGGIAFWFARRSRRVAVAGLAEAACPACLTLAYLAEQSPDLLALTGADAHTEHAGEPTTAADS